jgi:hypothetical protein
MSSENRLWILTAWHKYMCETSVFLVDEECLKLAGIDPENTTVTEVRKVYFGPKFSDVKVMEFRLVSDSLMDDLPLDMELRRI